MKRLIKLLINQFGFKITRIPRQLSHNECFAQDTMFEGIQRLKKENIIPNTIIDIGAAEGSWTLSTKQIWENGNYLLFEPLEERKATLKALQKQYSNIHVVHAGAGESKGEIKFYITDDLDGSGIADNGSGTTPTTIKITTVDEEVARLGLGGPYCLKLDTHGFEVPILVGASKVLQEANTVIIECYGFQIAPQSLLFWEMCKLMHSKGFRLFDIVDVVRRKKDNAFWQCDALFIKQSSTIFESNTYL